MKILIAGSNGMIGSAVTRHLIECGHEVVRLVRHKPGPGEVWWNPDAGEIDTAGLEGFDGVVHLASMPWPMRWTAKAKQNDPRSIAWRPTACWPSRWLDAHTNRRCSSVLQGWGTTLHLVTHVLTEDSPAGTSFLARLQQDGEAATAPASEAGIRVVHLRIPPVLGGARPEAKWVFRRGWTAMDELGRAGRTGFHHRVCPEQPKPCPDRSTRSVPTRCATPSLPRSRPRRPWDKNREASCPLSSCAW